MVKKLSRDDTRDDDAISELSRKLPKSFSLSLSQTTNERDDGEKETKVDGGEKETGRPTKVLLIRAE
jgi:hypothetical protein